MTYASEVTLPSVPALKKLCVVCGVEEVEMGESMGVGVGVGWVREGERGECLNTGWMSERVGWVRWV